MGCRANQVDDDGLQVHRCQQGDAGALAEVRDKSHDALVNILLSRGASRTEAEDLLADMWSDCVPGADDRPSLLEKFSGKCTLIGWLATVVTNRWIDLKRRQARQAEITKANAGAAETDFFERIPGAVPTPKEESLVALLRESLAAAFALCDPQAMILLRLVYLHDLTQREIVRMTGWSESKVSRGLSQAMEQIAADTLRELKKRDPWLELSWQDFVDLCETHQIGFL